MKVYNCDAQGNPVYTPRKWWDAWCLIFEMALCAGMAISMLIVDVIDRQDSSAAQYEFSERMFLAWITISHYLNMTRRK